MSFFSGKTKVKPTDLVKSIKDNVQSLSKEKVSKSTVEEISKQLLLVKQIFSGDGDTEPNQELITQIANEMYNSELIKDLIQNMAKLEFEAKKDLTSIFSSLLRRQVGSRSPTMEYLGRNPTIIETLIKGYDSDIALNCGAMLRECIRHEPLAKIILCSDCCSKFFTYVEVPNFDIASDAFATFKDLLTIHKTVVAEYLDTNYDVFFENYTNLLHSENYVTKRQSLKLLGELLLDRANFAIMTKFISIASNLKLMMLLLKDKRKTIQFEAFHVFKVFVANPNKPQPILEILTKNKDKLVKFLSKFQSERDDEQFSEEKAYLLKQIEQLE